jgi:signal transduction histidine kinase
LHRDVDLAYTNPWAAGTAAGGDVTRWWESGKQMARDWIAEVIAPRATRAMLQRTVDEQARAISHARREADEATRARDELLAIVAHELRNPLSPLQVAVQVMRLRGEHGRELDVIERHATQLARLIDDLLDISRLHRGRIELRRRDTALATVIDSALELAAPLLQQRGHRLDVTVPQNLIVSVDPDRMAQVISNLVINAAKYSAPCSQIAISAACIERSVRIQVQDEGIGIPSDMLDRVFEMFVQQPDTRERSRDGLGLGLAIVRRLVELHGGRVTAHSPGPGMGSTFEVELPGLLCSKPAAASVSAHV